jgi:hypothetical protein
VKETKANYGMGGMGWSDNEERMRWGWKRQILIGVKGNL